jgi:hypothetical protein
VIIKDTPGKAGFADFDTGDASSGQVGTLPVLEVARRMLSQRVILIIVAIEFCSGFLRQGVMKWFRLYAKSVGEADSFVYDGAAPVVWWRLNGAGHPSPSIAVQVAPNPYNGVQNNDVEFAELAWQFFAQQLNPSAIAP